MKIFQILPHLSRNGGIKVAIQLCHLSNKYGIESYVLSPNISESPYSNYNLCKFLSFEDSINFISPDDIFIFHWFENYQYFEKYNNKKYYFAQGCWFLEQGYPSPFDNNGNLIIFKNGDVELVTISSEVQNYFLYCYRIQSKILNNWINTDIFYPDLDIRVSNRIGAISSSRYNYSHDFVKKINDLGYEFLRIEGDENQVAHSMRTCRYFINFSLGLYNGWKKTEGFPLPSAEAMASGCIVLSYDNGGVKEYLFDCINGFLCNENTEDSIINKILKIKRLNLEQITEAGVNTIKQRFNEQVIFSQFREAFL